MATTSTAVSDSVNTAPIPAILLGGCCAGLADFIYPTVRTVMAGGPWTRPWKGVASGLFGKAAHDGGIAMAALGIALHFFICIVAAALLYFIASRIKWPPRHWFALGILHGLAVMTVMNYVILPLSAIGHGIYPLATLHITALVHILVVGLPTAFFVSRALPRATPGA